MPCPSFPYLCFSSVQLTVPPTSHIPFDNSNEHLAQQSVWLQCAMLVTIARAGVDIACEAYAAPWQYAHPCTRARVPQVPLHDPSLPLRHGKVAPLGDNLHPTSTVFPTEAANRFAPSLSYACRLQY